MKAAKTNNYPSWLVPIDIAHKLKGIGFNYSCLVHSVKHEKLPEDLFIALKDKIEVPTTSLFLKDCKQASSDYFKNEIFYIDVFSVPTWGQVLDWFRSKNLVGWVECQCNPEMEYYTRMVINGENCYIKGKRKSYNSYEKARETLIEELIIIYKEKVWKQCLE